MTRRIALTGGIATGKSHVRARLEALGVPTIDADTLARQAVVPGTPALEAIARRFGPAVIAADGSLDRKALGRIVFADAAARAEVEGLIHPSVRKATDEWFAALDQAGAPLGVADVPLLFEVARDRDFDAIIVVACSPDTQLERLMRRDQLTEPEARQRIAAQWPLDDKLRRADYVVRTDGTPAETDAQVDALVRRWSPVAPD